MMLEIGRVIADRYEITEKIGSGGMSIVYKALDRKLNRPVSFKVLREEYSVDDEFRKRFIREARSVASLNHQNIVNVYDVGQENDVNYIVMEYIDGMTLKDLINKRAPFSDQEVLGVAIQMAAALIHAHNSKIVHRDVKPQNVIVTGKGVIKMADFGIARKTDSDSVTVGGATTLGSVHYFSPEQAKGVKADPKSDLYSLGIVMFEMLTGEIPFDADTAVSVALMQINEPLPDIATYNPDTSPAVVRIVKKLTEKDPERRYQNAEVLLKDLRAVINDPDAPLSFDGAAGYYAKPADRGTDGSRGDYGLDGLDDDYDDLDRDIDEDMDDDADDGYVRETSRAGDRGGERDDDYDDYDDDDDDRAEAYRRGGAAPSPYPRRDRAVDRRPPVKRYEGNTEKRDRGIILLGALLALGLVALLVIFVLPGFIEDLIKPTTAPAALVTLPQMEGRNAEELRIELLSVGLGFKVEGEVYSEDVPEGTVISALYDPGKLVDKGTIVEVVVSLGRHEVEVPSFTGLEYMAAYALLADQGIPLILQDFYEFSETTEFGVIFDQTPKRGEVVPAGTEISIFISQGKANEKFKMPKLTGMRLGMALDEIDRLGLVKGTISYRYSDEYEQDIVMQQTVTADKEVMAGSVVSLVVSDGPEPEETAEPEETPGETESAGEDETNETPGGTGIPEITPLPYGTTQTPPSQETLMPLPVNTPSDAPVETPPVQYYPTFTDTGSPEPTGSGGFYVPPSTSGPDIGVTTPGPTPIVVPTDEPPVVAPVGSNSTKNIVITSIGDGVESANVAVSRNNESFVRITVFEGVIRSGDLPFTVSVTGTGKVNFYIHVNGTLMRIEPVDFDAR